MLFRKFALLVVLIVLAAQTAAAEKIAQHVVIISIDGFPAYLLDDPNAKIPNIRRLASEGVAAEGMRVINPSVTWPNHTSLVTGVKADKHGVLANGILTRHGPDQPVTIEPNHDQAELVHVPTLFDVLHQAGMSTAAINWPCTRNSTTLDDNFPDVPDTLQYTTPRLRQAMDSSGILSAQVSSLTKDTSPILRDHIWTEATRLVIHAHKPSLTLFHLLNVDAIHHKAGPQTPEGYNALGMADALVGRVLEAISAAGIKAETTVFIVADHGFIATPKTLLPNALLRRAGFLKAGRGGKIEEARAHVVPEGGMGLLYFCDPGLTDADRQQIRELFEKRPGIAAVVSPQGFAKYGLPDPRADQHMADLVLLAGEGYGFSARADGEELVMDSAAAGSALGHHGFAADHPRMNAVFVAAGAGVRPGFRLGVIANLDVAPTAAALLGVSLPTADGRVLREAFLHPPAK